MFRKLKECESCDGWDNGMKNRLRYMVGCAARKRHQALIAIEIGLEDEQEGSEHDKRRSNRDYQ